jgi:hypothetical protein
MIRRPSAPTSALRAAGKYFSTPHNSVRLDRLDRSILVTGCRSFEAEDFADKAMAPDEMHSTIKLMIATAVGRRGKWRTLWHGVTIKPVQP